MLALLDHCAFLDKLRENPADTTAWLVYADWLDEQDDPTGTYIRLALEFTAGRVPVERDGAHTAPLYELAGRAHGPTRKLLSAYRSALPLRLQVCNSFRLGHNPPRDMFGYERTIVFVAVLAGRLARGAWLRSEDGTWHPSRPLQGLERSMKAIDSADAGTATCAVGLFYLGHHDLPDGTILVDGPPPECDLIG